MVKNHDETDKIVMYVSFHLQELYTPGTGARDIVYFFHLRELYTPGMYADSVYMMGQVSM